MYFVQKRTEAERRLRLLFKKLDVAARLQGANSYRNRKAIKDKAAFRKRHSEAMKDFRARRSELGLENKGYKKDL